MKKLVKLIFFISIFLISSCSNISKNIDNASIQNNIEILSDIPGIGNKINERGQNLLWVKLKDGLRKSLRLPRDSASDLQHVKHNINKRAHD